MNPNELRQILSQIVAMCRQNTDKLNRVEANVAEIRMDRQSIKDAIDHAIDKLEVSLNAPED